MNYTLCTVEEEMYKNNNLEANELSTSDCKVSFDNRSVVIASCTFPSHSYHCKAMILLMCREFWQVHSSRLHSDIFSILRDNRIAGRTRYIYVVAWYRVCINY